MPHCFLVIHFFFYDNSSWIGGDLFVKLGSLLILNCFCFVFWTLIAGGLTSVNCHLYFCFGTCFV